MMAAVVSQTEQQAAPTGRERMLALLVAHVRTNGLRTDVSLRQLAADLGTSHRMLRYWFGSREGVLVAVLQVIRGEEQETFRALASDWGRRDAALALWARFTGPSSEARTRAFYAVVAQALQQPDDYATFLESLSDWIDLLTDVGIAEGIDATTAGVQAELIAGAVRGLLLDRLTSSSPERVDAAFRLLLDSVIA
jgi:AcrR family transcriptional regulator